LPRLQELRRVGIDYGRPGLGFKCFSCHRVFQYPAIILSCEGGHDFKVDEVELKTYPV
jgi:hypothetical protein